IVPNYFTVVAPNDTAAIYQADCVTPASSFNLGATVCAKITGAPLDSRPQRRLSIESPAGYIAAEVEVTSDPQTLTFTLPTSATVQLTDDLPANTNFVAVIQGSGPTFTCVNPMPGATTGTSTCTIASFARGDTAEFTFVYDVNAGAAVGTKISNTADVSSATT